MQRKTRRNDKYTHVEKQYPRRWPKPAGYHSVPETGSELSVKSLSERMVMACHVMELEAKQTSQPASSDILKLLTALYDDIEKIRLFFCRNITPQEFEENSKKESKAQGYEKLPLSAVELKPEFMQSPNSNTLQAQQADYADRFINNLGKFSWNCGIFLLNKLPIKMQAEQKKLTLGGNNTILPSEYYNCESYFNLFPKIRIGMRMLMENFDMGEDVLIHLKELGKNLDYHLRNQEVLSIKANIRESELLSKIKVLADVDGNQTLDMYLKNLKENAMAIIQHFQQVYAADRKYLLIKMHRFFQKAYKPFRKSNSNCENCSSHPENIASCEDKTHLNDKKVSREWAGSKIKFVLNEACKELKALSVQDNNSQEAFLQQAKTIFPDELFEVFKKPQPVKGKRKSSDAQPQQRPAKRQKPNNTSAQEPMEVKDAAVKPTLFAPKSSSGAQRKAKARSSNATSMDTQEDSKAEVQSGNSKVTRDKKAFDYKKVADGPRIARPPEERTRARAVARKYKAQKMAKQAINNPMETSQPAQTAMSVDNPSTPIQAAPMHTGVIPMVPMMYPGYPVPVMPQYQTIASQGAPIPVQPQNSILIFAPVYQGQFFQSQIHMHQASEPQFVMGTQPDGTQQMMFPISQQQSQSPIFPTSTAPIALLPQQSNLSLQGNVNVQNNNTSTSTLGIFGFSSAGASSTTPTIFKMQL